MAVTTRRVEGTRTTITALANDLADRLVTPDEPKDLNPAFAFSLPIMVIPEVLGTPRGVDVQLVLESANRDPRVVENPDRLDIRRDIGRIMSFGQGVL